MGGEGVGGSGERGGEDGTVIIGAWGDEDDADLGAVGAGVALDAAYDAGAGGADERIAVGLGGAELGACEAGAGFPYALGLGASPVGSAGFGLGELLEEVVHLGPGIVHGGGRFEACGVAVRRCARGGLRRE